MADALGRSSTSPSSTPPPESAPPATGGQTGLDAVLAEVNAGDPQSLYQEASAFDQVATHLQDVVQQFRNQARQLDVAWSGSSASAQSDQVEMLTNRIEELMRALDSPSYGNALRQAGDALANSQQRLRALQTQRSQDQASQPQQAAQNNALYDYQAQQILRDLSTTYADTGNQMGELPSQTANGRSTPNSQAGPAPIPDQPVSSGAGAGASGTGTNGSGTSSSSGANGFNAGSTGDADAASAGGAPMALGRQQPSSGGTSGTGSSSGQSATGALGGPLGGSQAAGYSQPGQQNGSSPGSSTSSADNGPAMLGMGMLGGGFAPQGTVAGASTGKQGLSGLQSSTGDASESADFSPTGMYPASGALGRSQSGDQTQANAGQSAENVSMGQLSDSSTGSGLQRDQAQKNAAQNSGQDAMREIEQEQQQGDQSTAGVRTESSPADSASSPAGGADSSPVDGASNADSAALPATESKAATASARGAGTPSVPAASQAVASTAHAPHGSHDSSADTPSDAGVSASDNVPAGTALASFDTAPASTASSSDMMPGGLQPAANGDSGTSPVDAAQQAAASPQPTESGGATPAMSPAMMGRGMAMMPPNAIGGAPHQPVIPLHADPGVWIPADDPLDQGGPPGVLGRETPFSTPSGDDSANEGESSD